MQETTCLEKQPLCQEMLEKMNAYWRAANYLSAGQLYLLDNPLLKKPLTMDHIKKKIVGHWGTVPGQNFVYVHCNRVIKRYDLDMILLSGPGHGGNFLIANTYLDGSYSEEAIDTSRMTMDDIIGMLKNDVGGDVYYCWVPGDDDLISVTAWSDESDDVYVYQFTKSDDTYILNMGFISTSLTKDDVEGKEHGVIPAVIPDE